MNEFFAQYGTLLFLPLMFVGMYFLMIRPENKKRKQAEEMRDSLKVGDEITTVGGMVGKVVNIKDNLITFESGEDRVRIQIVKGAISTIGKDTKATPGQ